MLPVRIALRFLKASRTQTVLIVLGLAVGISVQIFVGLLLQNLQAGFIDSVAGSSPHVTVLPDEDGLYISGWERVVEEVEAVNGIEVVSPAADAPAILSYEGRSNSLVVRGFVFEDATRIYGIRGAVYEGQVPTASDELLIGRELAEELGLEVGDDVTLVTADQLNHTLSVSGLFDLGVAGLNTGWVMMTLSASQAINGMGDNVTAIETQVDDIFAADQIARRVSARLTDRDLLVENWEDNNADLFSAINSQNASSYMIQTFVLMSVIIGIASVLSITVLQKSRQVGILKAMGISDRASSAIFLSQGLFLGVGGAVVGMSLGSALFLGFLKGLESSGDSIISSDLNWAFIAASGVVAILSAVFASLLPAVKSSRLSPIEVIRSG